MRILIIGNSHHQFIRHYVQALRNSANIDLVIDILSPQFRDDLDESDKTLFNKIYDLNCSPILKSIRIVRGVARQISFHNAVKHLQSYDITHVHYVEDVIVRDAKFFSTRITGIVIVTIWGSDFLRASKKKRQRMIPLLKRADKISIASECVLQEFKTYYKDIALESKLYTCYFGLQPLAYLDNLNKTGITKTDSKDIFNINGKIVITIGYNASILQRHIEIIDYIDSNPHLRKYGDNLLFLLPLTYPNNKRYIGQLKHRLSKFAFPYVMLENFLSEDKVAHLRNATDIFIQLQPTDMLSGSMLEHMAAGNIVITGEWLPYHILSHLGIKYKTIRDVSDVSNALLDVLKNFVQYKKLCENNIKLVLSRFKWENVIDDWHKLYY